MWGYEGKVSEIQQLPGGATAARILCPARAIPPPGRYSPAFAAEDVLTTPLFGCKNHASGFLAAGPLPEHWQPGTQLVLRAPQGHGFHLPEGTRRLALASFAESALRLLPLIELFGPQVAAVLYCQGQLPELPAWVEAYPLPSLPEALAWADFLAVDLPRERLPELPVALGLRPGDPLPLRGQALVATPMPCIARAECGLCSVETKRGWKLACKDGPVYDLSDLLANR